MHDAAAGGARSTHVLSIRLGPIITDMNMRTKQELGHGRSKFATLKMLVEVLSNMCEPPEPALGRAILTSGRGLRRIDACGWKRSTSDGSTPAISWRPT